MTEPGRADTPIGLCGSCRWVRNIKSDRGSCFFQCARATTDSRYPRYPRLPVIACFGYESDEESGDTDKANGPDLAE